MFVGVHATSKRFVEAIAKTGFLPGSGQYHWLGYGIYAFRVRSSGVGAAEEAITYARNFAEKKFPGEEIAFFLLEIRDENLLDLQHHKIFPLAENFRKILAERSDKTGLVIEPNDDWARNESHFSIDAYRTAIEALSPGLVDVVEAQFNGSNNSLVEERRSPEVCIKTASAIAKIHLVETPADIAKFASHAEWSPSNAILKAAKEASIFIRDFDDNQFLDFVATVAEGANRGWYGRNRFGIQKRVSIVFAPARLATNRLEQIWSSQNQRGGMLDIESLSGLCGPECSRKIEDFVANSDGLIAVVDEISSNISSVLRRAHDAGLPMLIASSAPEELPCEVRSARNVTILKLRNPKARDAQLSSGIVGFIADKWKDSTLQPRMRLMLAARNCDRETNASKIDHISNVRAIAGRRVQDELQDPNIDGRNLQNLPLVSEEAAIELRRRLKVSTAAISRHEISSALGPVSFITARITASGYLVRKGLLSSQNVIVLREGDSLERQKFTTAHEIGHAILDASTDDLPENEEAWCDEFASAILMPSPLIDEYEKELIALVDWLDIADRFRVSLTVAMRRVWETKRKLIVYSKGFPIEKSPLPSIARELIKIGKIATFKDLRGELEGAPYAIRPTKNGFSVVADFEKIKGME